MRIEDARVDSDTEIGLLSALATVPMLMEEAVQILKADYFGVDGHRFIWEEMERLYQQGKDLSHPSLVQALEKRRVSKSTKKSFFSHMGTDTDHLSILGKARQVRHWAHLRKRQELLDEAAANAGSDAEAFAEIAERLAQHERTAGDDASWLRRGAQPMGELVWANEMPEPQRDDILVKPAILVRRGVTLVSGPSKIGKSFLVLELARALAKQDDFLSLYPVKHQDNGYRVAYLQGELSDSQMFQRLQMLDIPKDRLALTKLRGTDFRLNTEVRSMNRTVDTGADRNLIRLARSIQKKNLDVVIFDPLYTFLEGSELDEVAMKSAFSTLEALSEITDTAIVLVHHNRKSRQGDAASGELAAGHSVLHRAPVAVLTCVNHAMFKSDRRRIRMHPELRCAPETGDVEILRKDEMIYAVPWESDSRVLVYEAVKGSEVPVRAADVVRILEGRVKRSQVYVYLKQLVKEGVLDHQEPHYWADSGEERRNVDRTDSDPAQGDLLH